MSGTIPINHVKVGTRARRDLGDLTDLMESIKTVGLLQPVVLDADDRLIAGQRRLEACRKLGMVDVPCVTARRVKDAADHLIAERDENTCRKPMVIEELVDLGAAIEEVEAAEAVKRMADAGKRGGEGSGKLPDPSATGNTRDKVGTALGISGRSYQKAKEVVETARDETAAPEVREAAQAAVQEMNRTGKIDPAAKAVKRATKLHEIAQAEPVPLDTLDTFPVLYVDPPWRYEHAEPSRAIENNYPTMSLDEIKALELPADPDAVLFMWVTSPKLAEGMEVLDAWGFNYRTSAVWVKDKIGMGYYFRQRHEFLLVAVKGSLPVPDAQDRFDSVIEAPRNEHSAKPERVYELLEVMYPGLPKVELFARRPREGWASWGNQAVAA